MDRVQKDLREYFHRDTVGFVTRQRPMDFVTSQQMMAIIESGWEEGGFGIERQAQVARVRVKLGPMQVRPMQVSIHGG